MVAPSYDELKQLIRERDYQIACQADRLKWHRERLEREKEHVGILQQDYTRLSKEFQHFRHGVVWTYLVIEAIYILTEVFK